MPPRIARISCACLFLTGAALPVSLAQLSEKIRTEILASFPKFEPPPGERSHQSSPVGTPAPLSDDPLVQLPDYHVRESRVPDRDPDLWLSPRAIEHKAMSDYSDSMTDLEWALNCWYIPFVTPSPQARANAAYANNKIRSEHKRLSSIAKVLASIDPAEAKKLLRDMDFSSHPR